MGMGSWRRAGRFGPPFPLNKVGDPALSQRGGLCHMVPHCLRDTWAKRERGGGARGQRESDTKTELNVWKSTKVKSYHLMRTWQVLRTHGSRHFSSSLLGIFPTLESFHSPQNSPATSILRDEPNRLVHSRKKKRFWVSHRTRVSSVSLK